MKLNRTYRYILALSATAAGTLTATGALAEADATSALKSCSTQISQVLEAPRPDPSWLKPHSGDSSKQLRIELSDAKGSWEFQCDRNSGSLTSIEWTGQGDSPLQAFHKFPYDEAVATVMNQYPDSRIEESSQRLEAGGAAFYELDVTMKDGSKLEVDVDSTTGALGKISPEHEGHS